MVRLTESEVLLETEDKVRWVFTSDLSDIKGDRDAMKLGATIMRDLDLAEQFALTRKLVNYTITVTLR